MKKSFVWVGLLGMLVSGACRTAWAEGSAEAGAALYQQRRCRMCHRIAGKGGRLGGPLDQVGSRRDGKWLREFIEAPNSVEPKSKMRPNPDLSDEDLDDLVAYLSTLKRASGEK